MDGYGNEEQRAAYRAALVVEKAGYAEKVAAAKAISDSATAQFYTDQMTQVDDEIARVDGVESSESENVSPADQLAAAKTHADLDALAAELGIEFDADVTTKDQKIAAIEAYLAS